eukprot:9054234-Pyramimonas_sp.AAC.1
MHPPVSRSLLISPHKLFFTARSARLKEGRPVGGGGGVGVVVVVVATAAAVVAVVVVVAKAS